MSTEYDASYNLRFEPEDGRRAKPALRLLDERLLAERIGHVAGTVDMGGIVFVALVELTSPYRRSRLHALLDELALSELCTVEERLAEDDGDDDAGEWR